MVIAKFQGGLGNQMFQYAAGLRLALKRRTSLKLDIGALMEAVPHENFVLRDYDLGIFEIPEQIASRIEVRKFIRRTKPGTRSLLERIEDKFIHRAYFREQNGLFDPSVRELPRNSYLDGYFQNEKYFTDIEHTIRERFRFPVHLWKLPSRVDELKDRIVGGNSVCLNVRRGDYVTNPASNYWHGVCEEEYFFKAMDRLSEIVGDIHYYVFSDDLAWCEQVFSKVPNLTIVSHDYKGARFGCYLWLMSQCKHFIIPNSSFAWWAAWLAENPGKIILKPSRWFRAQEMKGVDICPENWISVENA